MDILYHVIYRLSIYNYCYSFLWLRWEKVSSPCSICKFLTTPLLARRGSWTPPRGFPSGGKCLGWRTQPTVHGARRGFVGFQCRFRNLNPRFKYLQFRFKNLNLRFGNLQMRFRYLNLRFKCLQIRFKSLNLRFTNLQMRFKNLNLRFKYLQPRFRYLRENWGLKFRLKRAKIV